ncbi:MAG: hypothetical protein ACRDK2_14960, partial [Solirubrobacteraceae bacterium]
ELDRACEELGRALLLLLFPDRDRLARHELDLAIFAGWTLRAGWTGFAFFAWGATCCRRR